jgi:hypothetical protein
MQETARETLVIRRGCLLLAGWGILLAGCGGPAGEPGSREAAQMVLAQKGTFIPYGSSLTVRSPDRIPSGEFAVQRVSLKQARLTRANLELLKPLTRLEALDLQGTGLTNAGLAELAGLTNLRELVLYQTGVTDAGLVHLQGMRRLERLDLSYTAVTDKGLEALAGLRNLNSLFLFGTQVTDEGINTLKKSLPKLQVHR